MQPITTLKLPSSSRFNAAPTKIGCHAGALPFRSEQPLRRNLNIFCKIYSRMLPIAEILKPRKPKRFFSMLPCAFPWGLRSSVTLFLLFSEDNYYPKVAQLLSAKLLNLFFLERNVWTEVAVGGPHQAGPIVSNPRLSPWMTTTITGVSVGDLNETHTRTWLINN